MRALVLGFVLTLIGCQEPIIRYQDRTIDRPVPYPVYCIKTLPTQPRYITETLTPGVSHGELILSLDEETKQREKFTNDLLNLLQNCMED